MDDFGNELEEVKREILEGRALTIKTNNLVNALAADVKSIAKRQQAYERRMFFNSAAFYVVTIAVLAIATKWTLEARVDAVRAETKESRDRLGGLEKELKAAQSREEARSRSAARAAEFHDLVLQGKRREVVDGYEEIAKLDLTRTERAVFDAAVDRAKNELSLLAYQAGLEHTRTARWHEAQQAFSESLRYKPDAAHSSQAKLQLSRALRPLGRQREAIPILMQLSEASADKDVMDQATVLLAECQIDIQAWNDAKNTLRSFLRRFPDSLLAADVRLKLADLSLKH